MPTRSKKQTKASQNARTTTKTCLLTIGATATFDELIYNSVQAQFLYTLLFYDYTHLIVQYGLTDPEDFDAMLQRVTKISGELPDGIQIKGFAFADDWRDLLDNVAKGGGMMIAHAGSGSLMDGISFGLPTVLVPNTLLAENHQEELVEKAEEAGFCVRGNAKNLATAVEKAEAWRNQYGISGRGRMKDPVVCEADLQLIMDQEMGFRDRDLD